MARTKADVSMPVAAQKEHAVVIRRHVAHLLAYVLPTEAEPIGHVPLVAVRVPHRAAKKDFPRRGSGSRLMILTVPA
jgi:hypothetical protein